MASLIGTFGSSMRAISTQDTAWGTRLTDPCLQSDRVPFPLHPSKFVSGVEGGVMVLKLTLTDWAAFRAAEQAKATVLRQEADGIAPKF